MPVKHRSLVGLFINISFALGEALVGVYAIFVRNWRALQLTIVLPSIILASYYWSENIYDIVKDKISNILKYVLMHNLCSIFYFRLLPESLRWLIIKCKFVRAQKLIEKIATVNKITPPDCKFSVSTSNHEIKILNNWTYFQRHVVHYSLSTFLSTSIV